jgi:hypothetical protein
MPRQVKDRVAHAAHTVPLTRATIGLQPTPTRALRLPVLVCHVHPSIHLLLLLAATGCVNAPAALAAALFLSVSTF